MVDLKIDSQLPDALKKLEGISQDKWPSILSYAANQTGYYVVNKYKQQMPSFIDRPVPFTVSSLYLKPAKPSNLAATVQWRDFADKGTSAGKYLKPEVEGGTRPQKKFERALSFAGILPGGWFAIPTKDAPIDSYGNVPASLYNQILSYLRANPDSMQNRRVEKLRSQGFTKFVKGAAKAALNYEKMKKAEDRKRAKQMKFFAVSPDGNNPLPPGIYERVNLFGGAIRRLFNFVSKPPQYKATFPFDKIGTDAANQKFPEKLQEAIQRSMQGSKPE